jgi:cyclopropane fatty-acyl-phospholipid synthase-like methyltransferase
MPTTALYTGWDSSSDYHRLRESGANAQVNTYLIPFINDAINTLNLQEYSVADFACGHGSISREVFQAFQAAGATISRFGLLDVAADNLPLAEQTLKHCFPASETQPTTELFRLNGSDLNDFTGRRYDFVYSWDAMVHFDILDIAGYLRSFSRLCCGRAIFHHSNLAQLTKDISANTHWRNFMSSDIFHQLCISSGLKVIDQQLVSWGIDDLDCITYVEVTE